MKKYSKILKNTFIISLIGIIFLTTGCGKKDETEADKWQKDDNAYTEINESEEQVDEGDLNLAGKLYTKENKPKGSEEIVIYDCTEHILQIEPHTTYAMPENINIQYLLDIISVYSTGNTMEFTGYIIDNTAMVNIENRYNFVYWLKNDYYNEYGQYNKTRVEEKESNFYCQGFAVNALNVIDKTLKENLDIDTVVFKTNNDKEFLSLGEMCTITDGVYFNTNGLPRYLGSVDNYYGDKSFSELLEEYAKETPELSQKPETEQLSVINRFIN